MYVLKDIFGGRSIGKKLFGLAVLGLDNKKPKLGRLLLRNLLIFLWPIELAMVLISPQKRKLGDQFVHTDVVVIDSNRGIAGLVISIVAVFAVSICLFIFGVLVLIKQSGSYKAATDYIKNNAEIRRIVGNDISFGFFLSGGFEYNGDGSGSSELKMKVKGNKDQVYVHLFLKKMRHKDWIIEKMEY